MAKATINEVITYLKATLKGNGLRIDFIAVFGSALTGEMHQDSDLDLILVSKDFIGKGILERAKLSLTSEILTQRKFGFPMDVLNMTPEEYADIKTFKCEIAA